jgi:HSP20 family protein
MSQITVTKNGEGHAAPLAPRVPRPAPTTGWEPFRLMRDLMNWDPFAEMAPHAPQLPSAFAPSFEIKETKDGFVFKADVPGVKESDLDISLSGQRLSIGGKREAEKKEQTDTYYAFERTYGDFMRVFTLPDGVDASSVQAELNDGVLVIKIKKTPEAQPKKIAVQSAAKKP